MRAFIDFPESEDAPGRWRARFADPTEVLTAWHPGEVEAVLRRAQAHAEAGRWCLGALAYEAAGAFDATLPTHAPLPGWPLARFAVFDRALPWPETGERHSGSRCTPWEFSMPRELYGRRVERAREAMAAGECYQVNLTGALGAEFSGDVAQWMARMQAAQPGGYLLWLDWGEQQILSASPELFFDWRPDPGGGRLVCRPMKGTAPRHADAALDEQARRQLLESAKERAENVMIVDLLRNDLGRIAQPGSVRVPKLFDLQALPTVWQMTSTVTARTRAGTGLSDVFGALFPCGSVTGAPKVRAMHWIRELEDGPRGIYCGAAGVLRPGGAATFSVPIRTTTLEATGGKPSWSARYGVGSGVTFCANAQAEWQELAAKARLLELSTQAFDLLRNDLGRIAQPGSVQVPKLFELQALPTVWQMTSTVTARTRPGTGLSDVFGALFPCGSVTGAPKVRAMHWIRELEDGPRGIYCGAIGVLRPGGAATFNVPIRTTTLEAKDGKPSWSARYGVGSGVTFCANAQAEWQELAAKARLLELSTQAFDLLETLRLEDGRYWLIEAHLARMARSAAYFGFPWNRAEIWELLQALAQAHPIGTYRVRLTLAPSGRADAQAIAMEPSAEPVLFALAGQALDTQAADHEFVVHKTTRRDHYESRLRGESGLFDTLLLNERGELTEFTRGNVALKIAGKWLTPALHCGLLAGTLRADLLARGQIAEAVLVPADLERAQDVAFFNSVRGWLRAQLLET